MSENKIRIKHVFKTTVWLLRWMLLLLGLAAVYGMTRYEFSFAPLVLFIALLIPGFSFIQNRLKRFRRPAAIIAKITRILLYIAGVMAIISAISFWRVFETFDSDRVRVFEKYFESLPSDITELEGEEYAWTDYSAYLTFKSATPIKLKDPERYADIPCVRDHLDQDSPWRREMKANPRKNWEAYNKEWQELERSLLPNLQCKEFIYDGGPIEARMLIYDPEQQLYYFHIRKN